LTPGSFNIFKAYRVSGDDIVIGSITVAESYLKLMTDFGVSIQLRKLFISKKKTKFNKRPYKFGPLMNFANQIWLGNTSISPMPYSEFVNASIQGLPALKRLHLDLFVMVGLNKELADYDYLLGTLPSGNVSK